MLAASHLLCENKSLIVIVCASLNRVLSVAVVYEVAIKCKTMITFRHPKNPTKFSLKFAPIEKYIDQQRLPASCMTGYNNDRKVVKKEKNCKRQMHNCETTIIQTAAKNHDSLQSRSVSFYLGGGGLHVPYCFQRHGIKTFFAYVAKIINMQLFINCFLCFLSFSMPSRHTLGASTK